MIKIFIGSFAILGLGACAGIEELRSNIMAEQTLAVGPLIAECDTALFSGAADTASLNAKGLEATAGRNADTYYSNEDTKAEKASVLVLGYDETKEKCWISVTPDGFPDTIGNVARAEMENLGYAIGDRRRTYSKNGQTVVLNTIRSGNMNMYTTTIEMSLE